MNLCHTKEYQTLLKIIERRMLLNTENNRLKFIEYTDICKSLDENWIPTPIDFGPEVVSAGDETGASYIAGWEMFIAEDCSKMVLKCKSSGNIVTYNKDDMASIKNMSAKQMVKIHEMKLLFEGEIIDGTEGRDYLSKKNSALFKHFK